MPKYILRTFIFNLVIAFSYLGITSYWFISKGFDPIKTGLQQDFLMLIHLMAATAFPISNKTVIKRKHFLSFITVLLIIIIYFGLSNWIWNWLWSLR